jgi:hypothetical protein
VFRAIPLDEKGREVLPENLMVHRMLTVCEFKWKVDPDTGQERWLECTRCVSDGSVDKRKDISCYAETPDRVMLLLSLSLSATAGERDATADVERAYLNAEALDRNVLIIAPDGFEGMLPQRSLLHKGLYGERRASLGWGIWRDARLASIGYDKCDIAKGMYVKRGEDGEVVARTLCHTDDLKVGTKQQQVLDKECAAISGVMKMTKWQPVNLFLGLEIERVDMDTGQPDQCGKVVLVRQREKIAAMAVKFEFIKAIHNPHRRVRRTPGPVNVLRSKEDMGIDKVKLLSEEGTKTYQALVGTLNWLAGARPDTRYHVSLVARRLKAPRVWDMFCAVWCMDYFTATIDTPLVLGGPVLDPQATSDSSFATLEERETVLGYGLTTGPLSGAIEVGCKKTKCAVTNVWETELMALVEGAKGEEYLVQACNELGYEIPAEHKVFTDNQGVTTWIKGDASNRSSRHIDIRNYYVRHAERDGRIKVVHIPGKVNYADILTKAFIASEFVPLAARVLGHLLVQGRGIAGVFELLEGEDANKDGVEDGVE